MSLSGFWEQMARRGGRSASGPLLRELGQKDLEAWTRPNPAMFAWAEELRRGGWLTAILSNMPPDFMPMLREHFPEASRFAPAVFSCHVGLIKPEPGIYRHCLELLGLPAGQTLFLDDTAVNVESARRLGLHALQYRCLEDCARQVEEGFELPLLKSAQPSGEPAEVPD